MRPSILTFTDGGCGLSNQHHLGRAHTALPNVPQATTAFRNAIQLYRVMGNRRWEAIVLTDFGRMLRDAGHPGMAHATLRTALRDIAGSRATTWRPNCPHRSSPAQGYRQKLLS
jgi:hypothetical protein